jgi:hypothetical protein
VAAPWRGGADFTQQAFAAVGAGRYVHAVFVPALGDAQLIELSTGRTRSVRPRIEWAYDTRTGAFTARVQSHGLVFDAGGISPDPAVSRFARGYRASLAIGEARFVRTTTLEGQPSKVLRFAVRDPDGRVQAYEDVAVSNTTHRPLSIAYVRLHPPAAPITYRVVSIGSSDSPVRLPAVRGPGAGPLVTGDASNIRTLSADAARVALRHAALWPGRTVGAARLERITLQRVRTVLVDGFRTRGVDHGLRLEYGGRSGALVVEEAATPQKGYAFETATFGSSGWVPPPGQATISCIGTRGNGCAGGERPLWQAQLRRDGLFVTIRSANRALVVGATRSLVPIR